MVIRSWPASSIFIVREYDWRTTLLAKRKPARKKIESPFAKNLKLILLERGVSQKAAAAIALVSEATISDWLQGVQATDLSCVLRLAKALNCDFQWLLLNEPSRPMTDSISMSELFESEPDPSFSGIFEISAKRLRRKKKD